MNNNKFWELMDFKPKFDIVSFSGRKESGKTELANICVKHGYEKKSFAAELKLLVCKLTGLDGIDVLNRLKNKPLNKTVGDEQVSILMEQIYATPHEILKKCSSLTSDSTGRDWLQVVGTDLIRSIDPDWHVRKTLDGLVEGKKYVFDDTRFKNELDALKSLGAECWFIIRNKTDNISNHKSEIDLDYRMFSYHIIVNNSSLDKLRRNWNAYIGSHELKAATRDGEIRRMLSTNELPLSPHAMERMFIYKEFMDKEFFSTGHLKCISQGLMENDTHTGFIGDDS